MRGRKASSALEGGLSGDGHVCVTLTSKQGGVVGHVGLVLPWEEKNRVCSHGNMHSRSQAKPPRLGFLIAC